MNLGRFQNRWLNQSSLTIFGIIAFIVFAIAWSFWAELDQVSRAPGPVIPTGRIQVIQTTDGGQIDKIFVREGDTVKAGQVLVLLDEVK